MRDVRIGSGRSMFWAWSPIGWWLHLGRLTIGLRTHRHHGPMFSERYRTWPQRHFFHLGCLCLVFEWNRRGRIKVTYQEAK